MDILSDFSPIAAARRPSLRSLYVQIVHVYVYTSIYDRRVSAARARGETLTDK